MASIYRHNKSRKFFYQYYEYDPLKGKSVRRYVNLQTKDRAIAESEKKTLNRKYNSLRRKNTLKNLLLSETINRYLDERQERVQAHQLSERTYSTDLGRLSTFLRFITEQYGQTLITKISREHITEYERFRRKSVAETTIWIDLRTIKSFFSHFYKEGLLVSHPLKGYKIPSSKQIDSERVPNKEEWKLIVRFLTSEMEREVIDLPMAVIFLMCKTGMRISAASRLKWKKTETFEKVSGFRKSYSILSRDFTQLELFSKGRERPVNIKPIKWVFERITTGPQRSNIYVFGNPRTDRPYDYHTIRIRFDRMISDLNLSEMITPHSLRHGFVTRMVEITKNLVEPGEYVGHGSTYMTERYLHLLADAQEDFVNQIP